MIAWAHHWLYEDFWVLVWPNAGAVPLCAIVSIAWALLFRDRLGRALVRWLYKHWRGLAAELGGLAAELEGKDPNTDPNKPPPSSP